MPEVPLLFEDPKERATGRVTGRIGQLGEHLGRGGATAPIDDVHDLPLATRELAVAGVRHPAAPWALAPAGSVAAAPGEMLRSQQC